jgi:hypothetical protein
MERSARACYDGGLCMVMDLMVVSWAEGRRSYGDVWMEGWMEGIFSSRL